MDAALVHDLLKTAVMHDSVRPYFHIETQPSRLPVQIHNLTAAPIGAIELFGVPAVVADSAAGESSEATIIIDALDIAEAAARLHFRYPVEGLVVTADYARQSDGPWVLTRLDAAEQG